MGEMCKLTSTGEENHFNGVTVSIVNYHIGCKYYKVLNEWSSYKKLNTRTLKHFSKMSQVLLILGVSIKTPFHIAITQIVNIKPTAYAPFH